MKIREFLFKGFEPCTDGYCVIGGKATGMHTNGGCHCLVNMNRARLSILTSRLKIITDIDLPGPNKGELDGT